MLTGLVDGRGRRRREREVRGATWRMASGALLKGQYNTPLLTPFCSAAQAEICGLNSKPTTTQQNTTVHCTTVQQDCEGTLGYH